MTYGDTVSRAKGERRNRSAHVAPVVRRRIGPAHVARLLEKRPEHPVRRAGRVGARRLDGVRPLLELLHDAGHRRLVELLLGPRDLGLVGEQLVQLAAHRRGVVVARHLVLDLVQHDVHPVRLDGRVGLGGRLGFARGLLWHVGRCVVRVGLRLGT